MRLMADSSNKILNQLNELGPQIQWNESYITNNKIYCVYLAESEQVIRDHARKGNFACDSINEIKAVIDPTSEACFMSLPESSSVLGELVLYPI